MLRDVYSPSELNREVRLHIEAGFPRIWLEGEISNLSRPASGHLYFSLKDEKAQVRCALFRSHAGGLGFQPENGMQVRARGRLSLYEPRGDYQLIADILEQAGEGRLRAAYDALRKKLEAEGLFAAEAKQPLPGFPRRIAVVTSPSGAVIRDILHVLDRRWPLAEVRLYPVPVQGEEAPPAIVGALQAANRHGWAQVIILGRGGGSLEDLWAFNDEAVARAVFESDIPVISAVGHETDFSISDFVADLRAPTPTAAAELLTPDQRVLKQTLAAGHTRLGRTINACLSKLGQQHDHLAHRLAQQHPGTKLAEHLKSLHSYQQRLRVAGAKFVSERGRALQSLARTLHAVSPLPTLERGYAVVSDQASGRAISSVAQVAQGQAIIAQLIDGRIHARVDSSDEDSLDVSSGNDSRHRTA